MLATIVRASLANPRIVTALSLLVALLGVGALLNARLDVFPDFAPPHLLVQAEARGLDATQVEAMVTRPLEDLLAGAGNVAVVRSTSSQGLAAIQVVFGRGSDPYLQRFVNEFTETNNGKAFFASLDRLGSFIFRDFESGKRKTVY